MLKKIFVAFGLLLCSSGYHALGTNENLLSHCETVHKNTNIGDESIFVDKAMQVIVPEKRNIKSKEARARRAGKIVSIIALTFVALVTVAVAVLWAAVAIR